MKEFYVYEHWRSDRNEIFYVGKGTGRRAYDFKRNRNRYHKAIFAKLARIGAFVEIRIVAKGLTEREAYDKEVLLIREWLAAGAELANISSGGDGGHTGVKHTEEWKKRHGDWARQWFLNPENREKHRSKLVGRKFPEELKEKLRGPKSKEHIDAMRRSARGRKKPIPRTPEHRVRAKAALAEWRKTPEFAQFIDRRKRYFEEKRQQRLEAKRIAKETEDRALAERRFKQLIAAIANGTAKVCSRCKATKAPEEFSPNKKMKSGRQSYCKKCCAEYQIMLRQNNLLDSKESENTEIQLGLLDIEET